MDLGGQGMEDEQNNNERKMIRRPAPSDADKWNALPEVPKRAEMGYLHLSFEYHKGVLKVRVWQISDLLLPPPQISMIHSIFVRGYFIPDKARKTHRRTEDIVVDIPERGSNDSPKSGIQHIFTASSFKFRNPLLYTGVTGDIVKERSLQLEVCMTQKQTHRTFLMAMVHMPLRTAVRRPIREKYPLIPCMNITIPNNMRVYSAADLQLESSKGGDSRLSGRVASPRGKTPVTAREVELEDVVSLSGEDFLRSHLSLCFDNDDSEDDGLGTSDDGRLREVRISNGVGSGGSSSTTLNIPSSGDEGDEDEDDDDIPHVVTDSEQVSSRSTPIDMKSMGASSGSSSKKKIIPNELLQSDVSKDVTVEMPAEETVVEMEMSPSAEGPQQSTMAPACHVSPDARRARRKIIPAEAKSPNFLSEAGVDVHSGNGLYSESGSVPESRIRDNGKSLGDGSERNGHSLPISSPPRKKKIAVLPGEISIPLDSLPRPTTHNSMDSEGLSPHGQIGSELSPLQDSAFTPASRPETPCWDFYDFNEDLQPEEDLEAAGRTLDESLKQLGQQGIGSLQNLSKEPILPMVLVDDFDSLAVDAEQEEHFE